MSEKIRENIQSHLIALSKFTETPGNGVTRLPFTKKGKDAAEYLKDQMKKSGLNVREDASGAVIGRLEGQSKKTVIIGSHYDSVKSGGEFDGIAGVVCGIEIARLFKEKNIKPKYSIEIFATNDEEGVRFNSGFLSSKALLGEISIDELKSLADSNGITLYKAIENYGLNPEDFIKCKRDIEDIKAFLEIHIEQGPILENHKKEIGIVDTIVGMKRTMFSIKGRSDHAGTTPMNMRIDAVDIASKIISKVSDIALKYPNAVATVGQIIVSPNAINTIASQVNFSLDIRSTKKEHISAIYNEVIFLAEKIIKKYKSEFKFEDTLIVDPVKMNSELTKIIEESCKNKETSYEHINSGAGHDSLPIGEKIPTAMLFVPSRGGRSHCPEEFTDYKYLEKVTIITFDVINKII